MCFAQADGSTSRGAVNPPRLHHTPVLEFVMASWLVPVGVFFWHMMRYEWNTMDNVSKANINNIYNVDSLYQPFMVNLETVHCCFSSH